jgi:hypothetical protein
MTDQIELTLPAVSEEEQQMDWFVGTWDVKSRILEQETENWVEDDLVSTVEHILGGHAILEKFRGTLSGEPIDAASLRKYSTGLKRWEQAWIDTTGARMALYVGHYANGQFVGRNRDSVENPDTAKRFFRETFFDIEDNRFSWKLEVSQDNETWKTAWTLEYTRKVAD